MSVTIKTIAQEVGVTHGTVSRALKGDPRVNPDTARRILEAAEKLGYVRSRVAQGLRTSRSYTLGIVLANLSDPFFSEVMQGVHDTVAAAGFHLMVASAEAENPLPGFLQQRVDGLFLGCVPGLAQDYHKLMEGTLPLVMIAHTLGDYPYCVVNDEARGIRACVQHLRERGHRQFAYLGNMRGGTVNDARVEAFRGAAGPAAEVRLAHGGELESGYRAFGDWKPEALLCYNDLQAVGVLRACRERGLRVPADFSLMGFDDIELASYADPPLTTFAQPRYELGCEAGAMMLALLGGVKVSGPVTLPGRLVVRSSVKAG